MATVKLKAVGYIRVSTTGQAEHGFSIPNQDLEIRAYAAKHNMELLAIYVDDQTGTNIDRDGLQNCLVDLREGQANALIMTEPDRLTRKAADYLYLREELKEIGAQLHSTRQGWINLDDFAQELVQDIYGRMAQVERDKIVEKLRLGKVSKARAGKPVSPRWLPYGLASQGDTTVLHKEESVIVREIFEMYAAGEAIRGVARILNKRKVPTFYDSRDNNWNNIVGKKAKWSASTLNRMLRNRAYIGELMYGKNREQVVIPVPAIVDEGLFNQAQRRLDQGRQMASRNTRHQYLAQKRIICHCGQAMAARSGYGRRGKVYLYYICKTCKNVRADAIDGILWQWIKRLLMDPEYLTAMVERYIEVETGKQGNSVSNLESIRNKLVKNKQRQKQLAIAFIDEEIDEDVLSEVSRQLQQEKADMLAQEKAETVRLDQIGQMRNSAADLLHLMTTLQDGLRFRDDEPFEIRRNWVEALNATVEMLPDKTARFSCFIGNDVLPIVSPVSRYVDYKWQIELTAVLPVVPTCVTLTNGNKVV